MRALRSTSSSADEWPPDPVGSCVTHLTHLTHLTYLTYLTYLTCLTYLTYRAANVSALNAGLTLIVLHVISSVGLPSIDREK